MKNFTQIPNEILRDKTLTNTEFRILLYIFSHKNKEKQSRNYSDNNFFNKKG